MVSIDPADYVEASEGSLSLRFTDEKQQAKFELGVCMAVYRWEELNTAVENSWGGPKSAEKRDWISGIVIELFDEKIVDVQLIEETLLYAMVDEFDTEVDNDSALEIGALIISIYRDVMVGNYDNLERLYIKWEEKQASRAANVEVNIQEDPNNPDVSESEEEVIEDGDQKTYMDVEMEEEEGPVVDEDGFELVQSKNKRKGRR